MKFERSIDSITRMLKACAAAVMAWALLNAGASSHAQPPGSVSPDLLEIVKFTQARMTDDVILSYIKSSGKVYNLSADDMLYLNSQGTSQAVITAMLQTRVANPPAPAPEASVPPPAVAVTAPPETPTLDYFQAHLTPYGQWVDAPGIGSAWIPAEASNPGWRPYMDAGHWEFTDAGWFWRSDYTWGDMAFHYGRWINNEFTGGRWAWVPGYDWAPSWVSWREGAGGLGWAPLPWGVEFRVGSGLFWHGALVVDGVGFGLGFDAYVFVRPDHFWGGDYRTYAFDRARAREFYEHSECHAGYRIEGGRFVAEGLGREHMREITHHEIVVHQAVEIRHAEERHNFATRAQEHRELTRAPQPARVMAHPEASRGAAAGRPEAHEHATGAAPERAGATTAHSGSPAGAEGHTVMPPGTASHPATSPGIASHPMTQPGVASHPMTPAGATPGTTGHVNPGLAGPKAPARRGTTNAPAARPL